MKMKFFRKKLKHFGKYTCMEGSAIHPVSNTTPWTQDVNCTHIRRSEDVLGLFWTSCARSIYVLCLRGSHAVDLASFYTSSSNNPPVKSMLNISQLISRTLVLVCPIRSLVEIKHLVWKCFYSLIFTLK